MACSRSNRLKDAFEEYEMVDPKSPKVEHDAKLEKLRSERTAA